MLNTAVIETKERQPANDIPPELLIGFSDVNAWVLLDVESVDKETPLLCGVVGDEDAELLEKETDSVGAGEVPDMSEWSSLSEVVVVETLVDEGVVVEGANKTFTFSSIQLRK